MHELFRWAAGWDDNHWIAAGTIGLSAFTIMLVLATLILVKDGRDSSERELRAYIKFDVKTLDKTGLTISAGATPSTTIEVKNVGRTPARNVVVRLSIDVAASPLSTPLQDQVVDENTSRIVIFPADTFTYTASKSEALTAEDVSAISTDNATRRLYIHGRIDYDDVFGDSHRTTFRTVSTFIGGKPGLTSSAEGNDAY